MKRLLLSASVASAAFCLASAEEPAAAAEPASEPAVVGAEEASQAAEYGDSMFVFNAGVDLRIRQEIMHNIPQLPGGGVLGSPGVYRGKTKNQMRFRPDIWAELKMGSDWRIYAKLTDEFRAGIVQKVHNQTFPNEVVVDNLFVEGKNLFDGFLDLRAGRQNLYRLYGLDHVFVDGTPGDGSGALYANMVNLAFHFTEESKLDLFALYNADQEELRWGTKRSRHSGKTGFGRAHPEMDDWGFGAVWNSNIDFVDYQLFAMQKDTASFHDYSGRKHPKRQVNMVGTRIVPQWTEELSTPFEAMGQVGKNGDGDTLYGYLAYGGVDWKKKTESSWKPYASSGLMFMSGDKNAKDEDGGHHAWDPMWYRGVDDSEMFLYGGCYGCGWWSNQINLKSTLGLEFGYRHKAQVMFGPMWAETKDGLGGGDGRFKGFLTQLRYDFPIMIADKDSGGRLEIFGHVLVEYFNPGDYFETDKPAYFFRWQLDFRF